MIDLNYHGERGICLRSPRFYPSMRRAATPQKNPKTTPLCSVPNCAKFVTVVAGSDSKWNPCILRRPGGDGDRRRTREEVAAEFVRRVAESEDAPGHAAPFNFHGVDNGAENP